MGKSLTRRMELALESPIIRISSSTFNQAQKLSSGRMPRDVSLAAEMLALAEPATPAKAVERKERIAVVLPGRLCSAEAQLCLTVISLKGGVRRIVGVFYFGEKYKRRGAMRSLEGCDFDLGLAVGRNAGRLLRELEKPSLRLPETMLGLMEIMRHWVLDSGIPMERYFSMRLARWYCRTFF